MKSRKKISRNIKINRKKMIFFILGNVLISSIISFSFYYFRKEDSISNKGNDIVEKKISIEEVKANYSDYVSLKSDTVLYIKEDKKYVSVGVIGGEIVESLDSNYEVIDEYFKLLNSDYYVKYDSVEKADGLIELDGEYKYYKNYIPYNENVILNDGAKLYVDDINYYEVNGGNYSIIIKNDDRYGIEFNNRLVYINKSDVREVVSSNNTKEEITDGISVLNYHFVVSASNENGELDECRQSICITDSTFDKHIKYLKDNGYYSVSVRDLELFIDGKIQLPKKSVSITIDDGWYVARSIYVLEKYQMLGTLFLIGNLASPDAYVSNYLEVHSHTWDMHGLKTGDDCPNSGFRGGITCFDKERVLEDLKKSRESLGNTTYFCYPFYDYNNRAIELLKEAGFTMAFAGQVSDNKVRVGTDKFRIPRYVITNQTSMNTFIRYVS